MALPITPVRLGDVVKLKKAHPCGANEWEIVRVGADIGLRCRGCDRRVMLVRSEFDRRFRGFIERAAELPSAPAPDRDQPGAASSEAPGQAQRELQRESPGQPPSQPRRHSPEV